MARNRLETRAIAGFERKADREHADIDAVHVVSFRFGTLCVSLESSSAARTSYDSISIVLEPGPVDQPSLSNIDHFPNVKLGC